MRPFAVLFPIFALVAFAGAGAAVADDPALAPEGSVVEGPHFRAVCHFENAAIARAALAAAEGAWLPAKDLLKLGAGDVPEPLGVHLFRTPDDYKAVEQTVTSGRFARNNAFSSWDRHEAFVALEPAYDDAVLARVGLTVQTQRNLAHESAHLLIYKALPNFRHHPAWFAEGLAIWVADQAMAKSKRLEALTDRPFASTRMVRFQNMVNERRLPPAERILKEQYPEIGFNDRYALWWGFTRYLLGSRHAPWFRKTVRSVAEMPNSSQVRAQILARFKKRFGGDLTRLDAELAGFGASLEPRWHEPRRTLSVEPGGWTQLAFSANNAVAWRTGHAGTEYTIEGELEFLSVEGAQMNLLLGKTEAGFISVAMQSTGGVTVFRYRARSNSWVRFGFATCDALSGGGRIPFSVAVDGNVLEVRVDDQRVHRITITDADLTGPWGVGVQAGAAGVWHGVRIR